MNPALTNYHHIFRQLCSLVLMLFGMVIVFSFLVVALPRFSFEENRGTYVSLQGPTGIQSYYADYTTEHFYTSRLQVLSDEPQFLSEL